MAIEISKVNAVLLADGWHTVSKTTYRGKQVSTFTIDAYEYVDGMDSHGNYMILVGGGTVTGVPSMGFTFRESGGLFSGPLTSILAVRTA